MIGGADPERVSPRALERGREQLGTPRIGQSLSGNRGGGGNFRSPGSGRFRPGSGPGGGDDPQRLPGIRISGLRRFSGPDGEKYSQARFLPAGPPARLRPLPLPGGAGILFRHGLRRQLRLDEPADAHARDPGDFREDPRAVPRELGMRLLYDVCHNIAKVEEFIVAGEKKNCASTGKGRPGPSRRATAPCPTGSRRRASRC